MDGLLDPVAAGALSAVDRARAASLALAMRVFVVGLDFGGVYKGLPLSSDSGLGCCSFSTTFGLVCRCTVERAVLTFGLVALSKLPEPTIGRELRLEAGGLEAVLAGCFLLLAQKLNMASND